MPEAEEPNSPDLNDLFDNLPTAPAQPTASQADAQPPAPHSRRARRAAGGPAAERGASEHVAPRREPVDEELAERDHAGASAGYEPVAAAVPASTAGGVAADVPVDQGAAAGRDGSGENAAVEALFAPERHRHVPERRRGRGCLIGLVVVLIVLGGVAAGGAYVWSQYGERISEAMGWGEPKDYEAGQATGEALVTIRTGDTGAPVSTALYQAGVTKTDEVFYDHLIDEGASVTFYPGVYKLQQRMTAAAALKALQNPENRMENTVRIAEGSTVESSLQAIVDGVGVSMEDLQAAVADPAAYGVSSDRLDGWLYPAVYTFDPETPAQDVVKTMVERTRKSLADVGVPEADAQRVLTIASIIEREARTPDFAKVSRVIQNRLDVEMPLQMDSTAQYGYGELHAGKASTSEQAQHDDNPWNTYVITGLPANPIANPGEAAIDAAMHPADGPWLYFVTVDMDTGETLFTETYEQHQQGVEQMRDWCRAHPDSGC